MGEVRWTFQAVDDLEAVTNFIAADSPHYANLFAIDVLAAIEKLADFPRSGRVVSELNSLDTREILLGNYRIIYRCKKDLVEILTVYHCARLLDTSKLNSE